MTVTPLGPAGSPDTGLAPETRSDSFASALGRAFDAAGEALARADRAESAFSGGRGGLAEMVIERAQADVALSLAVATTSRVATALSSILSMQV